MQGVVALLIKCRNLLTTNKIRTKMKTLKNKLGYALCILLCVVLFSSCKNETQYDGLLLLDENTGKRYLLKHNFGDAYFIDEMVAIKVGNDTTYVFR